MEWSQCIETFVVVARGRSFVRAAEYFHTSNSAVSKRIQWLEHKLGTTLLRRTTRKVTLTEEGEALFNRASPLIEEWLDIKNYFGGQQKIAGRLNIATNPQLANFYIIPYLKKFCENYPSLTINLIDVTQPVHLLEGQIDVFLGTLQYLADPATAIAKKLGSLTRYCFASPAYLKKYGVPKKPEDLIKHRTLLFREIDIWDLNGKMIKVNSSLSVNTLPATLTAALNDLGIIFLPREFITEELKNKKLKPILEDYHSKPSDIYLAYPKLPYQPRKTKLFMDYCLEVIKL